MCKISFARICSCFLFICLISAPTLFADQCAEGGCEVLNCTRCTGDAVTKTGAGAQVTVMSPKAQPTAVPVSPVTPAYQACIPCGCGNGVKEVDDPLYDVEECDDGNDANGDGCDVFCRKEYCGDHIVNDLIVGKEQCDDGNTCDTDDCPRCKNAVCGDGFVWEGHEECDDANNTNTDACVACKTAFCGDGHVHAGVEQCDSDAHCDAQCKCTGRAAEPNNCGNGTVCNARNNCGECVAWGCRPPPPQVRNDGCFPNGVKILMADGSLKLVEEIKFGDYVKLANSEESAMVVQITKGPETIPLVEFGYAGKLAKVSSEHIVPTAEGLKRAVDLKLGDKITTAEKEVVVIDHLQRVPVQEGEVVRNFYLGSDDGGTVESHLMISDGFVTGDAYIQNNLEKVLEK